MMFGNTSYGHNGGLSDPSLYAAALQPRYFWSISIKLNKDIVLGCEIFQRDASECVLPLFSQPLLNCLLLS